MDLAMQLIFTPMIWRLLERRKEALARQPHAYPPRGHWRRQMPGADEGFRAAAFDLDGTLIDTAPDLCAAANAMLLELGGKELAEHRIRALVGDGVAKFGGARTGRKVWA